MVPGIVSRLLIYSAATSMVLSGCTTTGSRTPAAVGYGSASVVTRGENQVAASTADSSVVDANTAEGKRKIARRDIPHGKMSKVPVENLGRTVEQLETAIVQAENAKKTQQVAQLEKQLAGIVGKQLEHSRRQDKPLTRTQIGKRIKKSELKSGKDIGFAKAHTTEEVAESHIARVLDNRLASKAKDNVYGQNRDAARIGKNETSANIPQRVEMRKTSEAQVQQYAAKSKAMMMDGLGPNRFVQTGNQGIDDLPFQDVENPASPLFKKKTAVNKNPPNVDMKKADVPNAKSAKGGWEDSYEPNDYRSSAYDISSYNGWWLSSISGSGYQWDDDWYEIYAYPGSYITVDLRFIDYEGDIDLELVNDTGSVVASSRGTSDDEYLTYTVPSFSSAGSSYYIRVYYDDNGNSYDLKWSATGGSMSDDYYEGNDSYSSAYSLTSYENTWLSSIHGLGVAADNDYYRIEVSPTSRRVIVDLRFDHYSNGGDIELDLLNNYGGGIGCSSHSSDDDEYLDCTVAAGGTYYIKVDNYGSCSLSAGTSSPCNTYDLKWFTYSTGGVGEDSYEPNDYREQADTSAFPYAGDRTVYNLTQWDEDWYRIPVSSANRLLTVEADFYDYQGDIDIQLRSPAGTELISSMSTDDDEYIQYVVPAGYTYVYLRVFGDNAGNRYNLTVSDRAADDPYEENDGLDFMASLSNLSTREGTWLSNIQGRAQQQDDDYYFIGQVPALGRLMIDARFTHSEGDIDIQLLDQNGIVVANSIGTSNDEYIDTAVRPGLNYIVRVYGDNRGNSYDLKWNSFYNITRMRHAFSTAYYEPAISGQGHTATYLDLRANQGGEQYGIGWYTYHPDFPGHPFWLTAMGPVRGNKATMQVRTTNGGIFNACRPGYQNSAGNCSTPSTVIGTATIEITGCSTALFSFDIVLGSARRVGTQELINFGTDVIDGRDICTGLPVANPPPNALSPNTISMAHEGQWYDPRTSGQGLFVDILNTAAGPLPFFGWYTYGRTLDYRFWMTMQNVDSTRPTTVASISTAKLYRGIFDAPPRLGSEDHTYHGEGTITVNGCNNMTITFPQFNLEGQTTQEVLQLTRLSPTNYFEYMNGNQYVKRSYCQ